jgi:hypothetical protein
MMRLLTPLGKFSDNTNARVSLHELSEAFMNQIAISALFLICLVETAVLAQQKTLKPRTESKETKIARAISAGPVNIAKAAKVVDLDDKGNEMVLKDGTNGFTCYPGVPTKNSVLTELVEFRQPSL